MRKSFSDLAHSFKFNENTTPSEKDILSVVDKGIESISKKNFTSVISLIGTGSVPDVNDIPERLITYGEEEMLFDNNKIMNDMNMSKILSQVTETMITSTGKIINDKVLTVRNLINVNDSKDTSEKSSDNLMTSDSLKNTNLLKILNWKLLDGIVLMGIK